MKPWTWKQLVNETHDSDHCDAFVKQYGTIGAVALELAQRLTYTKEEWSVIANSGGKSSVEFRRCTDECGCAMCKQWHHDWTDERLVKLYRRLYDRAYRLQSMSVCFTRNYGKTIKP